ncbi:DUF805 domain-containing protein [Listeria booriae]|uniref:DUF805 domain-containing protein n=1 Tax=Listeria booriae TaxID=1552123 RepID=A0A841Y6Z0_9LIST|nr:DUF805 domain-containing protein [Listeria booriae]MBC1372295.1 DUF805 domain-containing protein [Listeria booriae]
MGFSEAYKSFWRNYVNFKDRAPRSAYWYVVLWNAIIVALFHIFILILVFTTEPFTGKDLELFFYFTFVPILFVLLLMGLYGLACFIPTLSLMVRRLRDSNKNPWFILLVLIPIIGGIILLVSMCLPSEDSFDTSHNF